jgi:DNA-binding beta-propeller fold protein YncE
VKRWTLIALALATVGCASKPQPQASGLMWPPPDVAAPAEVVWLGSVSQLQPKGAGRVLRSIAGAGSDQQDWSMQQPVAVALLGKMVFAVDTALGEVMAFRRDGGGGIRLSLPEGFTPVAVAADPRRQRLLVADRTGGAVIGFDGSGKPLGEVVATGRVEQCGGIAVCANGDIVLSDAAKGVVVRLDGAGGETHRAGRPGTELGEYNTPTAVVEGPDESIWVLDTFNFRVQRLEPDLTAIDAFGEHGDGSGQFALAKGLGADPDGHLYITDGRFDVMQVFDDEGRLLLVIGRHGSGSGEFWNPAGVAIGPDGDIVVADTGNRRIQLLQYQRRASR